MIFKNYKSKRKLRQENSELKAKIEEMSSVTMPRIYEAKRDVIELKSYMISENENIPSEYIKKQICHGFATQLENFVEWDFDRNLETGRVKYAGRIYISTKSKG